MAIGVSFTGYDGKRKEATASSVADLQRIMPAAKAAAPRLGEMFRLPGKGSSSQAAQTPQDFMKMLAQGKQDPVDGPLVGIRGNDSTEPDGQSRPTGTQGGFRIPVSRTEMKVEPSMEMKCNKVTLVKLEYDLIFSESGLLKGRSVESKVWEKSFFVTSEGEGEAASACEYGVRAFWDDDTSVRPRLAELAFGTSADLATYDKEKKDFPCNYVNNNIGGRVVANPPVKRIATEGCLYVPS